MSIKLTQHAFVTLSPQILSDFKAKAVYSQRGNLKGVEMVVFRVSENLIIKDYRDKTLTTVMSFLSLGQKVNMQDFRLAVNQPALVVIKSSEDKFTISLSDPPEEKPTHAFAVVLITNPPVEVWRKVIFEPLWSATLERYNSQEDLATGYAVLTNEQNIVLLHLQSSYYADANLGTLLIGRRYKWTDSSE